MFELFVLDREYYSVRGVFLRKTPLPYGKALPGNTQKSTYSEVYSL